MCKEIKTAIEMLVVKEGLLREGQAKEKSLHLLVTNKHWAVRTREPDRQTWGGV